MKIKIKKIYIKKKIINSFKEGNKLILNFIKKSDNNDFYKQKIFYKNYLDWLSKTLKMNLDDIRKEIFSKLILKKKKIRYLIYWLWI